MTIIISLIIQLSTLIGINPSDFDTMSQEQYQEYVRDFDQSNVE